ncbi:Hypothetical_protein [Hexamita inflata]|uniref:Hypothetical_protein n=1 Tax=Hexamita inflata TaxID=28002 RepID=A0AA86TRG6_9EUKA|nr:Hypothetical protein HINF_LOCUS11612 [Hexamita inflata]
MNTELVLEIEFVEMQYSTTSLKCIQIKGDVNKQISLNNECYQSQLKQTKNQIYNSIIGIDIGNDQSVKIQQTNAISTLSKEQIQTAICLNNIDYEMISASKRESGYKLAIINIVQQNH